MLDETRQVVAATREYISGKWEWFVAYGNPDGNPQEWELVELSGPIYDSYDEARENVDKWLKENGPKGYVLDRSVFGLDDPESVRKRKEQTERKD